MSPEASNGHRADGPGPTGRSTRAAILEVAVELLNERGPDGFTIDDVLVESSASASSLYHHFGNREGLVHAAQVARYRGMTIREDRRNLEGGHAARTTEEFLDYIAGQIRRIVTDPANREVRRTRLQTVALGMSSAELAERTRKYQDALLDVVAGLFDDAQARGLINRDLDTRAYSAWFHGMTLGRTIVEDGSPDVEAWLAIAIPAALTPLRPAPGAEAPPAGPDDPPPG